MTPKNREDAIVLKFNLIVIFWAKLGLGEVDV